MAAADDACTNSQSPDADDGLENSRIDKSCLVCGISKSEPPSKEEDAKEQLQPSSNSSPKEGCTHVDYLPFNPAEDIKEQLQPSSNSSPSEESTNDESFDDSPFNFVEDTVKQVQVKVTNTLVLPEQLQSPSEESGEKDQPVWNINGKVLIL